MYWKQTPKGDWKLLVLVAFWRVQNDSVCQTCVAWAVAQAAPAPLAWALVAGQQVREADSVGPLSQDPKEAALQF